LRVEPAPTPDEAAAIVAALEALRARVPEDKHALNRGWRLAGLLGHEVPPGMKLEGSLWSYSSWEGMT
jgi:hypothetical protein